MAYGTEHGLVVVDIVQKVCLLNMASPDLYGNQDPYSRSPRSPKRTENIGDQGRSPSIDQVSGRLCAALVCYFLFGLFRSRYNFVCGLAH